MEKGWREVSSGDAEPPLSVTSPYLWSPCGPKQGQIPVGAAQPQWRCTGSASSTLLVLEEKEKTSFGCEAEPMADLLPVGEVVDMVTGEGFPH